MKTIVVPVDFTDLSNKAMDFAIGLAHSIDAGLMPVHSYAIPHTGETFSSTLTELLQKNAEEAMEELVAKVPSNIPCQNMVTAYPLKEALQKLSKDKSNIWVVMATKGEQDWLDHQLGTNASHIVNALDVPVFLLPEDAEFAFPLKNALFATDGEPLEDSVKLKWKDIKESLQLNAQAIKVVKNAEDVDAGIFEEMQLHEIYHKNIIGGITESAEFLNGDLTVAVHHKRNPLKSLFHSSATKRLALTHKNPLLVLHE